MNTHVVLTTNIAGTFTAMCGGSRAQCLAYVRRRSARGEPTHFCHVVTDSDRARDGLRKRLGMPAPRNVYISG